MQKTSKKRAGKKRKTSPRSHARHRALQALYQWQIAKHSLVDIEEQFLAADDENEVDIAQVDVLYFRRLLYEVAEQVKTLDKQLEPLLDRPLRRLDPIEHTILRMGLYELNYCPEVPWRVVINESVELAHRFGADKSHKFINGILDRASVNRPDRQKQAK
ncbi:transcription antitermination factor NusB [Candidatus Venteria ishoeyi]|uniref:Transcription antitermination protein NusB n=1 Tax=Candidatus Venteria ishoeyi TaxID=1899563 RepID=A0A1H6FCZ2_9GAMM|nr:transcription antitermination factor NusB [Candidatus Venteria ishoeyi]MDM8545478.1 transcription antitermination factor NusB [Candidatus Venteria ishoeyi]SEH07952.1 N utilization substance protein B [Candidatus Venteria ishoeyi]